MKFNSQICTTKEQSERLLKLGIKAETADMTRTSVNEFAYDFPYIASRHFLITYKGAKFANIEPAWSLHRLIEMLNYQVRHNGKTYEPAIAIDGMDYHDVCDDDPIVGWSGDFYTDVIDCIEWLIKEEYFNKEYLEE